MLSSVQFTGAAEVINAGALGLLPTSANAFKMSFDVEEDEMLVEVSFRGYVDATALTGTLVEYELLLDGAAISAADGAMMAANGVADHVIEFRELIALSKGTHTLDLALGDPASAGVSLAGDTYPCKLQVRSLSSDAMLGHGVNAKSKGQF